jgi:hypothetical protein
MALLLGKPQRIDASREKENDLAEANLKIEWGPCCFCSEAIKPTAAEPCRVTVETQGGKWQVWFCHADCFKSRLTTLRDLEPGIF